ncbi:Squamosa promoter-binding-like protein, partial [Sarracenia purpurea var. burkii]
VRFIGKPLESGVVCLGITTFVQSKQQTISDKEEEPVSRPSKRVRSGSPGGGSSSGCPVCQVDNCREDLLNAKDYHRRHKVCEVRSKSSNALVGKHMQRFCQQCSRFHALSEFDEGKRSCQWIWSQIYLCQEAQSKCPYFSSESNNSIDELSPSSSPHVVQKLFPMRAIIETGPERVATGGENAYVKTSKANGCVTSLDLFGQSNRRVDNIIFQSSQYQAGCTSSSGSDYSPSSFSSDAQSRTRRMVLNLFGKNPSQLPEALQTQICNWLSHSPSAMESYIRPECVVLSICLSMHTR